MSVHHNIVREINFPRREQFEIKVQGFDENFVFQSLTENEINKCYATETVIDSNELLFIISCVVPDLKDKELQRNYKAENEVSLMYKLIPDSREFYRVLKEIKGHIQVKNNYIELGNRLYEELKSSHTDVEVSVRNYALSELKILPSKFDELSTLDKAYIVAVAEYKAYLLDKIKG